MEPNYRNDLQSLSLLSKIRFLLFLYYLKFREHPVQTPYFSRRARVHWIGPKRPRRPERLLFIVLLFISALVLTQHEYLLWAALWGGAFSIGINTYMVHRLVLRRRWEYDE